MPFGYISRIVYHSVTSVSIQVPMSIVWNGTVFIIARSSYST